MALANVPEQAPCRFSISAPLTATIKANRSAAKYNLANIVDMSRTGWVGGGREGNVDDDQVMEQGSAGLRQAMSDHVADHDIGTNPCIELSPPAPRLTCPELLYRPLFWLQTLVN